MTTQTIKTRLADLRKIAAETPLMWTPKKGDSLIGVFEQYEPTQGALNFMYIRDEKNKLHRVSISKTIEYEIRQAKGIKHGDLISIKHLGKHKPQRGAAIDVFSVIIERT